MKTHLAAPESTPTITEGTKSRYERLENRISRLSSIISLYVLSSRFKTSSRLSCIKKNKEVIQVPLALHCSKHYQIQLIIPMETLISPYNKATLFKVIL
jgi:hypothetical protein